MILLLPILLVLPGLGLAALLGKRLAEPLDLLERMLVVLSGSLLTAWLSLLLAEFGRFSLPILAVGVALVSAALFFLAHRSDSEPAQPASTTKPSLYSYLALGLIGIALLLSLPAHQYIIGGRDHGVYIQTGIHIAKQGSILFNDTALSSLPADLREVVINPDVKVWQPGFPGPWSTGQRLTGLTIRDAEAGIVAPHGFHFYPALIAIFAATGGPQVALYATLFAGLTALLAVYVTVRRVTSARLGVLLLLLLVANVAVQWYLSTPSAEILAMLAFWTGLWALLRAQEANARAALPLHIMAGFCFGALHLAKLDLLLVPVALTAYWAVTWLRGPLTRAQVAGIWTYLAVAAHAVLHAFYIATIYFLDHVVRSIFPDFLAEPLAEVATGRTYPNDILAALLAEHGVVLLLFVISALLGLLLLRLLRPILRTVFARAVAYEQWLRVPLVLLMAAWLVGPLLGQLQGDGGATSAFFLNRLYLTRIGLVVGMAGFVWLALLVQTPTQKLFMWMLFANSSYLFVVGAQTAADQFWSARRFVPVVFPALLLAGLWAVDDGSRRVLGRLQWPQRLSWLALSGLAAVLLAGFAPHVRPQLQFTEFDALYPQLEAFSAEFAPSDILLIEASGPAYFFTLPLWQTFDHTIFQIEQDNVDDARLAAAVAHWQAEERSVYWLKIPALDLPGWVENSAERSSVNRIITPIMEQPTNRIPHTPNTYDLTFELFRFSP